MPFGPGRLVITQATLRISTAASPKTFTDFREAQSVAVTASNSNAGTIFLGTTRVGISNIGDARRRGVPLTAGQTWTFTGTPEQGAQYKNVCFGTGYLYFTAAATGNCAIFTYYTQS